MVVVMHVMPSIIAHAMMAVTFSSVHTLVTMGRLAIAIPAVIIAALRPVTIFLVVVFLFVARIVLSSLLCTGIS